MKRTSPYRPDSPPASALNARPSPARPDTGAARNGDDNTAEQIHHQAAALEAGQIDPMPFPGPYAYDRLPVVADPPGQADGLPPLIRAAKLGDLEQLRMLLAQPGTDVNQVDAGSGATALFLAAEAGHPDIVELLLARGADVNVYNAKFEATALGRASFLGKLDVVEALLKRTGILLDQSDNTGATALIWAASRGHAAVVERLLKAGANSAWPDAAGRSALYYALDHGHMNVVECLLAPGAPCPGPLPIPSPTYEHFVCLSDLYQDWTMPATSTDNPMRLSNPCLLDNFDGIRSRLAWHLGKTAYTPGNPKLASLLASEGIRNTVTGPLARVLGDYDCVIRVFVQADEDYDGSGDLNSCQSRAYLASALSRLATLASDEQISAPYVKAGLSEAGVTRLSQLAIAQRDKIVALAEAVAAEQASEMLNGIVSNCRAETYIDLGANVNAIKPKLIDAGFIPVPANILVNSWHAALGELALRRVRIPQMGSIEEMTAFIGRSIEEEGSTLFAREIRRQLDLPELLAQWRVALERFWTGGEEGLFALFEDQCRQLREYCAQMEKEPPHE
jgi:ankyrin repeat protein